MLRTSVAAEGMSGQALRQCESGTSCLQPSVYPKTLGGLFAFRLSAVNDCVGAISLGGSSKSLPFPAYLGAPLQSTNRATGGNPPRNVFNKSSTRLLYRALFFLNLLSILMIRTQLVSPKSCQPDFPNSQGV